MSLFIRRRKRLRETNYLRRVARHREVRRDGRLPAAWLRWALSRYVNQRIAFVIKLKEEEKERVMSGVYVCAWKRPEFRLEFRKVVGDLGENGETLKFPMNLAFSLEDFVSFEYHPFWETLNRQLDALRK